jgi:predicted ATPase
MKLSVEGYKSIADKCTVEFNGLTVLAGANSSGKSSFMQPLLLIKQTLESTYGSKGLILDGPNVRLTDSSQIISKVCSNQDFFAIELETEGKWTRAEFQLGKKSGVENKRLQYKDENLTQELTLEIGLSEQAIVDIIEHLPDNTQRLLTNFREHDTKIIVKRGRNAFLTLSLDKFFFPFFDDFSESLEVVSKRLIHVPGLRGNPERLYKVTQSEGSHFVGSFEPYIASIVHKWSETKSPFFTQLQDNLRKLGLTSDIRSKQENDTQLQLEVALHKQSSNKDDFVNIADVGFGVSQTLPVLVALLTAGKGDLIYIEQPELHLHPNAQYALAEIIIEAVKNGKRVIIETHSSLLLTGIQTAVARHKLDETKVSLNWFTQDDTGRTKVNAMYLDKYGRFGDWPADFDEVALRAESDYLDAVEYAMREVHD